MTREEETKEKEKDKDNDEEKDTIYLVPHTHYDAIWVFTKEDYFYINLMLILREVARLVEETNYKFLIEQTFLLEELEKRYPEVFVRIAEQIKKGNIEIADGEYLMADTCLLYTSPSPRDISGSRMPSSA